MKKTLLIIAVLFSVLFGALQLASAVTIYTENWGNANTSVQTANTLGLVGWNVIANRQGGVGPYYGIYGAGGANDPVIGLGLPPNTVYFTGLTGTNQLGGPGMFYTTTESGPGSAGNSAFTAIDPTLYTNLTLNVEVRNSGGNLTNYFAVRVGGSWYVATQNPLPLYNGAFPAFTNATLVYTNSANVWNDLTIGTTSVTIGSVAAPNLSAPITGIGIVEVADTNVTGASGFNYNQIVINQGRGDFPSNPPINTAAAITPQTVYVGGGASFLTQFSGTPTLVYRWKTNGVTLNNGGRISGATGNMLTITNINANDALPTYSVVVTNFFGSATNDGMTLVVNPVPPDFLYAETFPYVGPGGNLPITGVGWLDAFQGVTGIYSSGPGIGNVFSYSGVATTNLYYTTTTNDTGASGLPFVAINPASYPAVTFQANFTPGNGAALDSSNVVAYWAVQMQNGSWYSSAKRIPVQTISQNNYQPYQMAFNPDKTNWNTLTIGATAATIGSQAALNLAGNITGAGVVMAHLGLNGGGDFNFNNFVLTTNAVTLLPPDTSAGTPINQDVASGGGASFSVSATGAQPFTYGWLTNGVPVGNGGRVSDATTPTLTIANLNSGDNNMSIVALVTNAIGDDRSDNHFPTTLTVSDPPVGLLYSEKFPFVGPLVGNYPISSAGWVEAVSGVPNALYHDPAGIRGDGAVFAFLGTSGTTAYYTSTATDTNQAGLPFPNINLASYPDLTLSVDIAPTFSSSNVTAFLAVQLNGGSWYVAASALPVPTASDSGTFSTYTTVFDPAAANWKNVTITGSGALIGSAAASNLSGVMTGAGLVFVTVGTGGNFNFDNFVITGTGLGGINVGPLTGGNINLSWVGNPVVNLQSSTNLSVGNWLDVPNTLGLYSLPVSVTGPQKFFRLVQHP